MSGKRGMSLALLVTAVGAALVLATAGQPRWSAPGRSLPGSGASAATALALVALAGIGLLLLLRGRARTVVGLLVLAAGVAVLVVDVRVGRPTGSSFLGGVTALPANPPHLHRSSWFWLTAAGGVAMAVGGAVITVFGHRWPSSRREYRATSAVTTASRDPWTALDRGEDPTL
ncbi:MAG: Trp biosynthesis-associated membrane protein [Actinomycetes bacterium]